VTELLRSWVDGANRPETDFPLNNLPVGVFSLAEGSGARALVEPFLVPMATARLHLPFAVSEYTDFYAGRHHATNVGTMFRGPESALLPN
jgi:hypothetical protein